MSQHYELYQDVPQGPQPRSSHRRDQEAAGRYREQGGARAQGHRHHHPGRRVNNP